MRVQVISYLLGALVHLNVLIFMLLGGVLSGCGDITVNADQPSNTSKKDKKKVEVVETEEVEEVSSEEGGNKAVPTSLESKLVSGQDGYAYFSFTDEWFYVSPQMSSEYECPEGFAGVPPGRVLNGPKVTKYAGWEYHRVADMAVSWAYPGKVYAGKDRVFYVHPDGEGTDTWLYRGDGGYARALYKHELPQEFHSICYQTKQ